LKKENEMDLQDALKALAKETKKPIALLKTNYDAGDQLIVGRINDLLGIKATRREIQKEIPPGPIKPTAQDRINATRRETPEPAKTQKPENATRRKSGRPQLGEKPLTSTERVRVSRERRKRPDRGYSGKMLSTMISGEAHSALNDLLDRHSDKTQKEIIEQAIIHYNQHNQGATT
jgi:hypothetical protein